MSIGKVNIRPGVSVLSVLRHLNYKPWYALGEFVDNSVESYMKHREELRKIDGKDIKLKVDIRIETTTPTRISIRDNAAGIFNSEYKRAFRPAAPPPDRSGLSEFGMGMKSAACWFAPRWSVRTSAIGEPVSKEIFFDIKNIVNDDIEELEIKETKEKAKNHFTEVILEDVFRIPKGRTLSKLKEHLTDIYRIFIRKGLLDLYLNEKPLIYEQPKILKAPYFKDKNGENKQWRKAIKFDFGKNQFGQDQIVHGFAALREKADTARAGFSLFRRNRVIQGSGDEGYRPHFIFGSPNTYRYQRLFGELHLEGFEVSHTKDGFRWDDETDEFAFLQLLKEHLDSEKLPLLKQADGYRSRTPSNRLKTVANDVVKNVAQKMESSEFSEVLSTLSEADAVGTPESSPPASEMLTNKRFDIHFRNHDWSINIELTNDPAVSDWLELSSSLENHIESPRKVNIRVSMAHPFMVRFAQTDTEDVEALLRLAAALAVSEILAQEGVNTAAIVRRNINAILKEVFSET